MSPAPLAPTGTMTIARQPILDVKKAVYGFELFDRAVHAGPFSAASDAALLFNLLSNADPDIVQAQRPLFINCTHQTLVGGHLELIEPDFVVLEVPALGPQADAEDILAYQQTLQETHKRGFRLAFGLDVLDPA
jgi:EAL and modified HD-GYP domain-containing signal transduction protein